MSLCDVVTRAVVAQHLDGMRRLVGPKPLLDRLQHHVPDVRATDAGVHDGRSGDDLAIVRVDEEGAADDIHQVWWW